MSGSRPRVAWVTNDLPPRSGGIQQFVASLLERTADAGTLVVGPAAPEGRAAAAAAFDASGAWRTIRASGAILPTPATARWVAGQVAAHRPDVVVIASLWPLGLLAPALHRAVGAPVLGLTHGAEAGLARGPGRLLLRVVTREVDRITVISDFTGAAIAAALPGRVLERLAPGVDLERFDRTRNAAGAAALRARWGVPSDAQVVGCIARLVPRKGQDMLLRVWPQVVRRHPSARLVLVGEGPARRSLERAAVGMPTVHVVGSVGWEELPAAYAALDLFAMPVRTRHAGFDVEGLGISFLEAQAAGLPVVAGRSGGAPETVADERIGSVVDGRRGSEVVVALDRWLADLEQRALARQLGPELALRWSWSSVAQRFDALIDGLVAHRDRR